MLSRTLADSGHYPAIDIEASISRVMPMVVSEEHQLMARRIRQVYSNYKQNQDLISIGAYAKGSDPRIDLAIRAEPAINALLQQGMKQVIPYDESLEGMAALAKGAGARLMYSAAMQVSLPVIQKSSTFQKVSHNV